MSQIAPSKCPECSSPAYIGMNRVECVKVGCRHFSASTWEEWDREGRERDGDTDPMLSVPALPGSTWVDHVLNSLPMDPFGGPPWTYQLPRGMAFRPYLKERFQDTQGRWFEVCSIDRFDEQVTVRPYP